MWISKSSMLRALPAITLTVTLAAAAPAVADTPALKAVNCAPAAELRGDGTRGAALHLQHCAQCHGVDGKSEVTAMQMEPPPGDQSDAVYMKTLTDAYIYLAICKGGIGVGKNFVMPAWGDLLSDQDIKDLVAHIRTLSGT